jgi:hypothetical protein
MTISKTPWQYNAQHMAVYDPQGRAIAVRPNFSSCAGVTEAADMQLVAAAPDLLAALLPLVEASPVGGGMIRFDGDQLQAAIDAIAKARGA